MKGSDLLKQTKTAIEQLSNELDQGMSQDMLDYLTFAGRFHRYSFRNQLLIRAQKPGATFVKGFRQWQNDGVRVTGGKGCSIAILAPMSKKVKETDPKTGEETERKACFFRAVRVFDISDTDAEAPDCPAYQASGNPGDNLARLWAWAESQGITVEYRDSLDGAQGMAGEILGSKQIRILSGRTQAQDFQTLAHELAHCALHVGAKDKPDRATKEAEAEAVAYVVCQGVGVKTGSVDYLSSWKIKPPVLAACLTRIQKTASQLLTALEAETVAVAA